MATSLTIATANVPALIPEDERLQLPWPERAKALKIVDARSFQLADNERSGIKAFIEEIHGEEDAVCKSAWSNWQLQLKHRSDRLQPFEDSLKIYDRGMNAFEEEEKAKARAEQRRIEQEAFQKQLEEREQVVEHVEATGGSIGEVKSIIERAVPMPVGPQAVMQTAAAPIQANNSRKLPNWKGEITDMWAFCEFAVKNNRRELIALVVGDTAALTRIAGSTKGAMEVPGLRIWDEGKRASLPKKAGA